MALGNNGLVITEAFTSEVGLCLQSGQQHLQERGEACQSTLQQYGAPLLAMIRTIVISAGRQADSQQLLHDAFRCIQGASQIKTVSLVQLVAELSALQAMIACIPTAADVLVAAAADALESVLERGKWMTFIEQEQQAGRWEAAVIALAAHFLECVESQKQRGIQRSQSYLHSLARVAVSLASADTQLTCAALASETAGGDGSSDDPAGAAVMRQLLNMIVSIIPESRAREMGGSEAMTVGAVPLLFLLQFLPRAQRIAEPRTLCVHLLPVLVDHSLPPYAQQQQQAGEEDEDELAEWQEYREHYVGEVLSCCCNIVGAEAYFTHCNAQCNAGGGQGPMGLERMLYCVSIPTVARLAMDAARAAAAMVVATAGGGARQSPPRAGVSHQLYVILTSLLQQYLPQLKQPQLPPPQELEVIAAMCHTLRVYAIWCLQEHQRDIAGVAAEFLPLALTLALPTTASAHDPGYLQILASGEEVQTAAARALATWGEYRAALLVDAHPLLVRALHPAQPGHATGGAQAAGAAVLSEGGEGVGGGGVGGGVCANALVDAVRGTTMASLAAMARLAHAVRQGSIVVDPRSPLEQLALALRARLLQQPSRAASSSERGSISSRGRESNTVVEWQALEQLVILCAQPQATSAYVAQPSVEEAAATAAAAAEARVHVHRMIEGMWPAIDSAAQSALESSAQDDGIHDGACLASLQFCATSLTKMDTLWLAQLQQAGVASGSGHGAGAIAPIVPPLLHAMIEVVVRCHTHTSNGGSAAHFSSVHVAALRTLHVAAVQPCLDLLQNQSSPATTKAGAAAAAAAVFIVPLLQGMLQAAAVRLQAAAGVNGSACNLAEGGLDLSHPDGRAYLAEYLRLCTRVIVGIRSYHVRGGAAHVCPTPLAFMGTYGGLAVQCALAALAHEAGTASANATVQAYTDADPLLAKAAIGLLDAVAVAGVAGAVAGADGAGSAEGDAARALILQPRAAFGDGNTTAGPLLLLWLPLCGLIANAPGFQGETATLGSLLLSVTTLATAGSGCPSRIDFAGTEMQLALQHCAPRLQRCVPPIAIPADVFPVLSAAWGRDNPALPAAVFERLLVELMCICKGGTFEANVLTRYATDPIAVLEGGAGGYESDY
jgi:hypothetical protein